MLKVPARFSRKWNLLIVELFLIRAIKFAIAVWFVAAEFPGCTP